MVFVCHVTLQDRVIKVLIDFTVRSTSEYVTILLSLVVIGNLLVKIKICLPRDFARQVISALYNFMARSPSLEGKSPSYQVLGP